jgi:hypothetical protein
LIACDEELGGCGKRHRDRDAVVKCRARNRKRRDKAFAKRLDDERRDANLAAKPVADMIQQLVSSGMKAASIGPAIRADYPPDPLGRDYDRVSILWHMHPPRWPMDPAPVAMDPGEQLALARVKRLLSAAEYEPPSARFVAAWRRFAAAPWEDVSPWKTVRGEGSAWWGWGSDLVQAYDEYRHPEWAQNPDEEDDDDV